MTKNYLQSIAKSNVIKRLKTGDIIRFESDVSNFVSHYAIVIKEKDKINIYHNQKEFVNSDGGSLVKQDVLDYSKGRSIISVENTNNTKESILEICNRIKDRPYNSITYNCEHFANLFKGKKMTSPQVANWGFTLSCVMVFILLIKK